MRAKHYVDHHVVMVFGDNGEDDLLVVADVPEGTGVLDVLSDKGFRATIPAGWNERTLPSGVRLFQFDVAPKITRSAEDGDWAAYSTELVRALIDFADLMHEQYGATPFPFDTPERARSFLAARGLIPGSSVTL